jgi:DNA polymerase III subunit epsilon
MCRDFRAIRDGFPDLMLAKDGKISFSELKAEGDVIRRNQLTRLRQVGNAEIPVEIGRVLYRFDPVQDYVAVDVETTGGMASFDRIRDRSGQDSQSSSRRRMAIAVEPAAIPSKIIQLTGITNEMARRSALCERRR